MQKLHITSFFKFPFFKCIINVTCNYGLILLKQFSHLSLCQPHRLIFQPDINLRLPVWSLIDSYTLTSLHFAHYNHELPRFRALLNQNPCQIFTLTGVFVLVNFLRDDYWMIFLPFLITMPWVEVLAGVPLRA